MYIPMWLLILLLVAIVGGCSTRAVATGRKPGWQVKRERDEIMIHAPARRLAQEQARDLRLTKAAKEKADLRARAEAGDVAAQKEEFRNAGGYEWHGR